MAHQSNEKGQYRCDRCQKTFETQNELRQHHREQHGAAQQQQTGRGEKTKTAGSQGQEE